MFEVQIISDRRLTELIAADEGHFFDVKGRGIQPAKVQESFVAFANADGGDLYVGIEDRKYVGDRLRPFSTMEDANAIVVTLLEQTKPSVEDVIVEYLQPLSGGYLLHFSIPKSTKVHYTADGDCFIRINAQKIKIKGERVTALAYAKGATPYERVAVGSVEVDEIMQSAVLRSYLERVDTSIEPRKFLHKQRLLTSGCAPIAPNVGCVLLFDEQPQASIETRCAIKVYRLRTSDSEYKREHLAEMPATINGSVEQVILGAIKKVGELLEGASYHVGDKLVTLQYPAEAIKELLVNAVVHRDYSLNDDIHVRIYDNRLEITSPGKLPGYITTKNIYEERFSRNPNVVRLLHNLPNPLNHDIGEGLDTVRNEWKKVGLVEPVFEEHGNAFVVTVKHQRLASVEDVVREYLQEHPTAVITNKLARQISGEDDINKVKKALQKLRSEGEIVIVDEKASAFNYQYRKA